MLNDTDLIGKIATFVVIGLLGWLAFTTNQMSVQQAVQGEQIKAVQTSLAQQSLNRYTRSEAVSDMSALEQRILEVEKSEILIRDRVREIERDLDQNN